MAEQLQQHVHAFGRVGIVLHDQDARTCLRPAGVSSSGLSFTGSSRIGSETSNSLPVPRPSLRASTLPPCIVTSCLTSVKPDTEAALRAIHRDVALREKIEHARKHLGRDADAGIAHANRHVGALAPYRKPRCGRARA